MTAHPYADTLQEAQEAVQALLPQLEPNSGNDGTILVDAAQFDAMVKAVVALGAMIREQYLRDYAETLLLEHAKVELMSVSEMADEFLVGDPEITEEEMRFVHSLIAEATVTVRIPPLPVGVDE